MSTLLGILLDILLIITGVVIGVIGTRGNIQEIQCRQLHKEVKAYEQCLLLDIGNGQLAKRGIQ